MKKSTIAQIAQLLTRLAIETKDPLTASTLLEIVMLLQQELD